MDLLRTLLAFLGLIVGFVGIMIITMPWWYNTTAATGWVVLAVGVIMWVQAIPVMRASERAERKQHYLEQIRKRK
ncbi:hypothetical protein IVB45_02310 [Bradyrhizobium sp. 4]|uniref:hypothetical protein n=1 Tax=Bradyrhizobium sp. 4 TaxID=2782678 RepID=UPI001FFEDC2A|nr:hypothetical protein [Bradyrhizobium sp. 4]UPJ35868.1 hypothetical protein IVB45_02310 [Bradyrhizobium sp. 4]